MSQQIMWFERSRLDLIENDVSITVTDSVATDTGQDIINYVRNRSNLSAWVTTGSTDAGNTTLTCDFGDIWPISELLLVGHNFKAFTIKYHNGSSYVDFSTPVSETTNSDYVSQFSFDEVNFQLFQIIVTGTQVADAEKVLRQLIATKKIGEGAFEGWPIIKKTKIGTNKKKSKMLSGKVGIVEGVEVFSTELTVKNWKNADDLTLIEDIYFKRQGVLAWLCGGDEDQFSSVRKGYRKEDIYLVRPTNEWNPDWSSGLYKTGMKVKMPIAESRD